MITFHHTGLWRVECDGQVYWFETMTAAYLFLLQQGLAL
jgi:hypothetical protein